MRKRLAAFFDANDDGEVDLQDLHIFVPHQWMFIAGLFILIGAIGNVLGLWAINSDAFWAAAGGAAMLEYVHDTIHITKRRRGENE